MEALFALAESLWAMETVEGRTDGRTGLVPIGMEVLGSDGKDAAALAGGVDLANDGATGVCA